MLRIWVPFGCLVLLRLFKCFALLGVALWWRRARFAAMSVCSCLFSTFPRRMGHIYVSRFGIHPARVFEALDRIPMSNSRFVDAFERVTTRALEVRATGDLYSQCRSSIGGFVGRRGVVFGPVSRC